MGAIRVLSAGLVNRIAAGECVERPSSVVKELVENALDAGAGRVDIAIEDGGRGLIRVSDDGSGMDADDLRLAIEPHTTSKIRTDDDLFNIHTMGFRGEAIASIASVSRLRLVSRPSGADIAHELRVEGGRIGDVVPVAAAPGTTVEVRDLFYCVPARRRFLRTNATETGHVTEQLARIALAHPGVAFRMTNGKRVTHDLPATDEPRRRIGDFFGEELAAPLLHIVRDNGGVRLEGLVAPPAEARGSSKWEYVFVNGRYIRDRFVSHAVREAYRSLIDPSAHPVVFLFLTVDPSSVDVNVHPTKIEVRWRDSNFVHSQVLAALREKFLQSNLDRRLQTKSDADIDRERVREAMVRFFRGARPHHETSAFAAGRMLADNDVRDGKPDTAEAVESARAESSDFQLRALAPRQDRLRDFSDPGTAEPSASAPIERVGHDAAPLIEALALRSDSPSRADFASSGMASDRTAAGDAPISARASPRAIQIHNSYLVVETEDGLMIVDQHALHERVLYEQFQLRVTRNPLESQRMLIPASARVRPETIELLERHAEVLERLGLDIRATGPQSVAVHAFPTFLERVDPVEFTRDLLDRLSAHAAGPQTDTLLHELLDMMACKAAVKAGDRLTDAEIASLLEFRDISPRASNCPHGRPTTLRLTLRELEKQFMRR